MKRLFLVLAALAAVLATPLTASAQAAPTALLYNDGTAELQPAYDAFADQLSRQGSLVSTTVDAGEFSAALATGGFGVYGAFGADAALLDSWLAQAPTNSHFLRVTLAPDGDLDTEYVSFLSPTSMLGASTGRRVVGTTVGGPLTITKVEEYSTRTADGRPAQPVSETPAAAALGATPSTDALRTATAAAALGWPWDGIVEAIGDLISGWIDDILEWLQCVGACAAGCVDTFLDAIPEGVEVEITVEVQTTPPGVKTSIKVKATGQAAVKVMRAYAEMIACLGNCVANCSGAAGD